MIVRSKKELVYGSRDNKKAIIAMRITDWSRSTKHDRFTGTVEDMIVTNIANPEVGSPQKSYEIIGTHPIFRTNDEVNQMFAYIGIPIAVEDDFNAKLDQIIINGLLIDTQITPVYGSVAEDWEIVDETLEIEPEPPII